MDLDLDENQRALRDAVADMVSNHMEIPRSGSVAQAVEYAYADALERELSNGDFFSIGLIEGGGALEAALLIYEICRSPQVLETGASMLVGPGLTGKALPRPIAIARKADLTRGVRFLDRAKTLIVDLGDDVAVLATDGLGVEPVPSMYAYPLGRLAADPDISAAARLGSARTGDLRRLWRIALALEAAAALQAAVDFTTGYVKDRRVFGRPVGSFQAVQHRLAADVQQCRGAYWLALRAAWSGDDADAALAALYAQRAISGVNYDAHQFNGALGMTLEHSLHFWTFRLRWLQGELGGPVAQARDVARLVWPNAGEGPRSSLPE
jgi:alkylation response protein AidB-like acyl-CoA dehydrogenase